MTIRLIQLLPVLFRTDTGIDLEPFGEIGRVIGKPPRHLRDGIARVLQEGFGYDEQLLLIKITGMMTRIFLDGIAKVRGVDKEPCRDPL